MTDKDCEKAKAKVTDISEAIMEVYCPIPAQNT